MFVGIAFGWALWCFLFTLGLILCDEDDKGTTEITPKSCLVWIMGCMFAGAIIGYLIDLKMKVTISWPLI